MTAFHWLSAVNGSFTNPANWSGDNVPGPDDTAILDAAGTPYTVTYDAGTSGHLNGLRVASNATFDVDGRGGIGIESVANNGTITVNTALNIGGVCKNSGLINLANAGDQFTLLGFYAHSTLTGGGQIVLENSVDIIAGVDEVINEDNAIVGVGTILISELVNEAEGVIDGNGSSQLTIDAGAFSITNGGTIESTGSGGVLLRGKVVNNGVLSASDGAMKVVKAVNGSGSAMIDGGTLEFRSAFNQDVTFNSHGTLELARSREFTANVTGFSKRGKTSLDLGDIGFVNTGEATFSGTASGGVLTVTDGTHTANINLKGNYLGSSFVASSDGHGNSGDSALTRRTRMALERRSCPLVHCHQDSCLGLRSPKRRLSIPGGNSQGPL